MNECQSERVAHLGIACALRSHDRLWREFLPFKGADISRKLACPDCWGMSGSPLSGVPLKDGYRFRCGAVMVLKAPLLVIRVAFARRAVR